jgi:hypothetical protein
MKRSKFNLSHYHLTSGDMGQLLPVGLVEVLPGDSIRQQTAALLRVTPQVKPLMHPVTVHIHHYYVPNRTLWSGWEDFITGESATPPPTISGAAHSEGSLMDYLGIYDDASNDYSALPIRAYNAIYNTYYRDQDLVTEVSEDSTSIQNVAWQKDYFTSSRPWAQKGTAVTIPLGSEAPIFGDGMDFDGTDDTANRFNVLDSAGGSLKAMAPGTFTYGAASASGSGQLKADLSNATGADIREFREALAMQRYQEARARYGSNYIDYLSYIGVNGPMLDARLQQPEYLGGGKQGVSFSEVINQNFSGGVDPSLGGHGIAALRSNRYTKYFPEHGWIMTMLFVRPKAIYTQTLPKKFFKSTKEEYYQKELADVGAQEVLNKELYAPHTTPDGTFGFSNRYAEYFSEQSRVSAEMRNSTNYDFHMGRIFSSDPALNQTFVECDPTKRCFADQTEDSLWIMVNHDIKARRMCRRSAVGRVA